jgi:hypothetical protein
VTSPAPNSPGATGDEPPPSFFVPQRLTPFGRREFIEQVQKYATHLAQQLELNAHGVRRDEQEYTVRDVQAAQAAHEQKLLRSSDQTIADRQVMASILLTVATLGITTMSNFLNGGWELAVFAFFVLSGLLGLTLTWTNRRASRR